MYVLRESKIKAATECEVDSHQKIIVFCESISIQSVHVLIFSLRITHCMLRVVLFHALEYTVSMRSIL